MGINSGRYGGVGVNPLLGQQFTGTVTIQPTEQPNVVGLSIQDQAPGRTASIPLLQAYDYQGVPIVTVARLGQTLVYGDYLGAYSAGATAGTSVEMAIDGKTSPPSILTGILTGLAQRIWFGNNTPTADHFPFLAGGINDWFFNFAGSTSTTHMYRCSAAGTPGTWVGFA